MNSDTLAADAATDTAATNNSQDSATQGRVYTQQEFDDAMAKMKAAVAKKVTRQFEELGDIEELRQLKSEVERRKTEDAMNRGEFEKILQDLAARKDSEIARRDAVIREYRVDTPLVTAAAQLRSINPEQVRSLLKPAVRLNGDGEVEVVDTNGQVRYGDSGQPLGVADLVREFLEANPHFVQPTPATTNTRSSITAPNQQLDITKLDMKNPEHRKVYAEYRRTAGLAR
jgi:hypothetical protein